VFKSGLRFLSIVAIASVLSGCLSTFPKPPAYRECGASVEDGTGRKIIYCEWMYADKKPEIYNRTEKQLGQFLMIPLVDIPRIEKYEAEVHEWVGKNCK
jgi:hypothetical protein